MLHARALLEKTDQDLEVDAASVCYGGETSQNRKTYCSQSKKIFSMTLFPTNEEPPSSKHHRMPKIKRSRDDRKDKNMRKMRRKEKDQAKAYSGEEDVSVPLIPKDRKR